MALENTTVMFVVVETPAPLGVTVTMVGWIRSTPVPVVNTLVIVPAIGLPCTSVTPVTEIV